MDILMEGHSGSDTILDNWEARSKFISFMLLLFSFSFVKNIELIPLMLLISTVLFIMSGLPFSFLLSRWKIPALFIIIMGLILLLFSSGKVVYSIGLVNITREGFSAMLLLVTRFLSIMTLIIILFATTPFLTIIKVMRSMGLPEILADMTMFTYRYLFEIAAELRRMRIAMKLRGFKGKSLKDLAEFSYLVGSIFVHSYEQSERIYQAMRIRGYGENYMFEEKFSKQEKDKLLCSVFVILAVLIDSAQIYLSFLGGIIQ